MSDKPILFSAQMIRALLVGTKTQTRRAINPQPSKPWGSLFSEKGKWWTGDSLTGEVIEPLKVRIEVGDHLYVREHWRAPKAYDDLAPSAMGGEESIRYEADQVWQTWGWPAPMGLEGRFRQGMHMPRWASRITLTVTEVRVQRLQDITEADAWAEGCKPGQMNDRGEPFPAQEFDPHGSIGWDCARDWYADLWEKLHGESAWDTNPWVAAYSFTVQHGNIDQVAK